MDSSLFSPLFLKDKVLGGRNEFFYFMSQHNESLVLIYANADAVCKDRLGGAKDLGFKEKESCGGC